MILGIWKTLKERVYERSICFCLGASVLFAFSGCTDNKGELKDNAPVVHEKDRKNIVQDMEPKVILANEFRDVLRLDLPDYPFFSAPRIIYALRGEIGGKEQRAYLVVRPAKLGACFDYSVTLHINELDDIDFSNPDKENDSENANLYAIANKSLQECHSAYEGNVDSKADIFTHNDINTQLKIGFKDNALLLQGIFQNETENIRFKLAKNSPFYGQKFSFTEDTNLPVHAIVLVGEELSFLHNEGVVNNPKYSIKSNNPAYTGDACFNGNPFYNSCLEFYPDIPRFFYQDMFVYNNSNNQILNQVLAHGAKNLWELREYRRKELANLVIQNHAISNMQDDVFSNSFKIRYLDSKLLVLEDLFFISKKGEAHPYYTVGVRVYDVKNASKYANQLHDIFLLDNSNIEKEYVEKELLALLTQKLNMQKSKDHIFHEQMPLKKLPETFVITDSGIEFIWQLYEIAPYSSGIIRVHVPFAELRKYINSASVYSYLFD